ncbi:MAG: hypothetical protein ABIP97_09000 [Chthoniobacterales bacterium]
MRILETALIISCVPILGLALLNCRLPRIIAIVLLVIPATILVVLLSTLEMRLHFIPAYFIPVLLSVVALIWLVFPNLHLPTLLIRAGAMAALFFLAGGAYLTRLIPVLEFPTPPGSYQVGVTDIVVNNTYSRKLRVRIWYPAEKDAKGPSIPYLSSARVPDKYLSSVLLAKTNALKNVKMAPIKEGCPVILYSPEWLGECYLNTTLFEALASEGFVVVAIEIPSASENPSPLNFSTKESLQRFDQAVARELKARMSDMLRVYASLPDLQSGLLANGILKEKLNLSAVGAMGYSFGGAVTAEALLNEPSLRSGINFDGTLFGASAKQGAKQPFLFITHNMTFPSEEELQSEDSAIRREAEFGTLSLQQMNHWLNIHGGYVIRIDGAQHSTFCDIPLYAYKGKLTGADGQKAIRTLQKVNLCAVAFFNKTLRGQNPALLEKEGFPWSEIEVRLFFPQKPKTSPGS